MKKEEFLYMATKISNGKASDQEIAFYNHWYNSFQTDLHWETTVLGDRTEKEDQLFGQIKAQIWHHEKSKLRILWPQIAAVACIFLMLAIGGLFLIHKQAKPQTQSLAQLIAPGSNKAILTLGNGQNIVLAGPSIGKLAQQGNIIIRKSGAGEVIYAASSVKNQESEILYNTIATPRGGQYWVILADGSRVFLNAASSLKYPVAFNRHERVVELTGEAYFEVVHNGTKPFKVKTDSQIIEDVGTHFNVNAYSDEPDIKTTLLEGSVKVTKKATSQTKYLMIGQQSIVSQKEFIVRKVNVQQMVAWKDGLFVFDHTNLNALMRQVSRWYNIQVVYDGAEKNDEFFGEVERKYSLAEVLKVLELGGLHFRIEGSLTDNSQKKLIVMR